VTGIVLAGGVSRRLGADKALLTLDGETFLARAVRRLSELCQEVLISVRPGQVLPDAYGLRIVEDAAPGLGPLGGLAAGLAASDNEWHLVLACDLPAVRPELLELLGARASGVDAVVPHAHGRLQPLVAAYARTCLEPAQAMLSSGRRAVAAMLEQVRVSVIEEHYLRAADPDLVSFQNVNTWADYQAVLQMGLGGARPP